jgi:diaminopimelate epimerase
MRSNNTLYKYQGAGNDFVLIEAPSSFKLQVDGVQRLCDRHHGLGADGLLQIEKLSSSTPSWRMRIYNKDGSIAQMCGNGLRCVAAHIWRQEGCSFPFSLESDAGRHEVLPDESSCRENSLYFVKTCFGKVTYPWGQALISLPLEASCIYFFQEQIQASFFLNSGVPHLFFLIHGPLIETSVLHALGKYWRHHSLFSPEGTNVSMGYLEGNTLKLRTYERGVEEITLACGTAAVAASAALWQHLGPGQTTWEIEFPGEPLIRIEKDDQDQFWLTGPAAFVFETQAYNSHFQF